MSTKDKIWKLLEEIPDPEIPVLTIHDLGIVRKIDEINNAIIAESKKLSLIEIFEKRIRREKYRM